MTRNWVQAIKKGDRRIVLASIAALAAAAWLAVGLVHTGDARGWLMHPAVSPPTLGTFAATSLVWLAMMAAMMLPAVWPWVIVFSSMDAWGGLRKFSLVRIAQFLGGYFAIWAVFSLAAAGGQLALQSWALLGGADVRLNAVLGGAVLLGAGLFQLTPLKAACLRHCRTPLSFFLSYWRGGPLGPFQMGLRHGFVCLICCWGLMLVAFAVGIMNLAWMALIALIIVVERQLPGGPLLGRLFGIGIGVYGLYLLAGSPLA